MLIPNLNVKKKNLNSVIKLGIIRRHSTNYVSSICADLIHCRFKISRSCLFYYWWQKRRPLCYTTFLRSFPVISETSSSHKHGLPNIAHIWQANYYYYHYYYKIYVQVSRYKNLTPDVTKFILLELNYFSVLSVPFAHLHPHQQRRNTCICCSKHGKFNFTKHTILGSVLNFDSLQPSIVQAAIKPWV